MIIVIASKERNEYTGKMETVVSHGIDLDDNDRIVVLPQERDPSIIGAVFDLDVGEYVLYERNKK
jgi:hypothetical protein